MQNSLAPYSYFSQGITLLLYSHTALLVIESLAYTLFECCKHSWCHIDGHFRCIVVQDEYKWINVIVGTCSATNNKNAIKVSCNDVFIAYDSLNSDSWIAVSHQKCHILPFSPWHKCLYFAHSVKLSMWLILVLDFLLCVCSSLQMQAHNILTTGSTHVCCLRSTINLGHIIQCLSIC